MSGLQVSHDMTFLDVQYQYKEARAVVIPFGLEQTVSYETGTFQGPDAILHASAQVELFDEDLWNEPVEYIKPVTLEEPECIERLPLALTQLSEMVQVVLEDGKFPMVLGGEHSITPGAIRPFLRKYKDEFAILHFDAHADLRNEYDGNAYSHASAIRRCMDDNNVRVASFGIRNISGSEVTFLDKNKSRMVIYWSRDKDNWDMSDALNLLEGKKVYVTFDLDAFDSSLMPAVGTPEPGGLFWYDAINVIRCIADHCHIVGADVNELAPRSGLHACNFLAAKLVYKIMALSLRV